MSMICLGDVTVVFDGSSRLCWDRRPRQAAPGDDRHAPPTLLGVWPEPGPAAALRLRVRLGWPTVVVLDPYDRPVQLPHHRVAVPTDQPSGLVELTVEPDRDGPDRQRRLAVTPMSWMSPRDRLRGERFLDATRGLGARTLSRGVWPVVIEDDLVGGSEPLRFVCVRGSLALDQLERLIERIYHPSARQASVFESRSRRADLAARNGPHGQECDRRTDRTA